MSEIIDAAAQPMDEEQILAGIAQAKAELTSGEGDFDAVLDRMLELQVAGRAIGMSFDSDETKEEPSAEPSPVEQPAQGRKVTTYSYKSTDHSAGRKW